MFMLLFGELMGWDKKIMGLGLGWFLTGPIGAILGGVLGAVFDSNSTTDDENTLNESQGKAVYHAYLVSLFMYIAKSDGKLSPIEVKIIRDFFSKKGLSSTEMEQIKNAMKIANKQKNIDIYSIISQLNKIFDYSTRLNILEL